MTLIALYAGCFVLGGILIGASVLGASKEADASGAAQDASGDLHTVGADPAGDAHADTGAQGSAPHASHGEHADGSGLAATLLSLRFWTFSLASFGMSGLLLAAVGTSAGLGFVLALLTGLGVGAGVTTALRNLSRDTVSSALEARSLRGRDAEVVLSVGPGKRGKVRLTHHGQLVELPAITRGDRLLERTERVLVVDVVAGEADVTSLSPDRPAPSSVPTTS